ncbi:energy-coupled thiamine transporter ThiT [Vagococcus elongatus]|uniref:Energy-coupled thiamine transporter ThiT n=1 Tax=Vagococcus elongatus TaxID=180344 RepID=A0A430B0Z8_9ENTE|nr:energy-coupled thiamine transporter ThiT [Vagococcus elongatus]RSU13995.1 energy-coupled thiamine transporter ThiT [Vagococcus elongatus]
MINQGSKKRDLSVWVEGTIVAAMGMVLTLIPANIGFFDLSLGLVPLALYSLRRGLGPGMVSGFIWGLLAIVSGGAMKYFLSVPQIIFEYPFAFAFGGFGGIVAKKLQAGIVSNNSKSVITMIVFGGSLAALARFFWHFWAGVAVWGSYAPENMSPYVYSLIINGTSGVANAIYVVGVLLILYGIRPQLFVPTSSRI